MAREARSVRFPSSDTDGDLAAALRRRILGEVRFDAGTRALYATDASNYRQVPIGVVLPKNIDDVVETIAAARRYGAPVLARGGGTSLAGQCCNIAVVIDFSKYMHRILAFDPQDKRARVEPGVVLDDLRDCAEEHHLTFGPDPSTHNHCTLGGMIGNNSCGVHSVMAGKTDDNVEELDIITYDGLRMRVGKTGEAELDRIVREGGRRGEIYSKLRDLRDRYGDLIRGRFPNIPRRVSGYNLPWLLPENGFHVARALVGSECTCVTVIEATVRLVSSPPARSLLVLGYPDVYQAGDHIPEVLAYKPIALEGLDDHLVSDMKKKRLHPEYVQLLPDGGGWLLVEFGGDSRKEADDQARALMEDLKKAPRAPTMKLFNDPQEERTIWLVRRSGLGATARVPGKSDTWEGWEDSAVPPDKLGGYLRDLRKLLSDYGYGCALYGHFGQGCVHTRIDFDLVTRSGIERYRSFIHRAADLVIGYGGSLSGEHGDGQSRGELLPKMFGPELMQAFREFKSIWDPDWKMNPGKVIDARRADEDLRLGADYHPAQPQTHFKFPGDDKGSFSRAALRCVGVGECRREAIGTMCPSYRVTREEMHSTRGRARLLFEMFRGRCAPIRLAQRSGQRSPRPLPRLQGMQGRLPRKRRYGDVQSRIPFALLRRAAETAPRLCHGLDLLVGPPRGVDAHCRQSPLSRATAWASSKDRRRDCAGAPGPRIRPRNVHALDHCQSRIDDWREWPAFFHARSTIRAQAGNSLARHIQQSFLPGGAQGGGPGAGSRRLSRNYPRRFALLRPASVRFRHAR
jgi:FAD/FMN-containing dehydrogenase